MRAQLFLALFVAGALQGFGQAAAPATPASLKDPRAILEEAAPFYDFSDPALKPWHLKATYQLYDDTGTPTEQGTYEYWWASPKVYRSTWARPGATHNDWHTADGKHEYAAPGEPLRYFEYKVQSALLSPLPDSAALDPAKGRLDLQTPAMGGVKFPCVMLVPKMPDRFGSHQVPLGQFPTYCFDPNLPLLRINSSFGTVQIMFNQIVKVQGKYLAREIGFSRAKNMILSITVDKIDGIAPSDAALTPPVDATVEKIARKKQSCKLDKTMDIAKRPFHPLAGRRSRWQTKVNLAAGISYGSLIKKQQPFYPQDAKDAHVSGTVVLQAVIGRDGGVYDLQVVSAPWPSRAASALSAVSQWQYKPYLLNGEPVEVETTVNVIYQLGQ